MPTEMAPPTGLDAATVEQRFKRLSAQWKKEARFLSNTVQMAMLMPYQRIVGMGMPVVPLILRELQREPNHWFWALEAITEETPSLPPDAVGNVRRTAEAWIEWGRQHGYVI